MGFSGAVEWWEEWQLRVLVLASGFLQFFLFFAGILRKRCIPSWLRFLIWLAYLSSDAVAIYGLATLFNRQKTQEWVSTHQSSAKVQALWAPMLLIHLGGTDGITTYSIEDNELWRRHVLTAVSQVAVAVYVFRNSWPQDKRTLATGVLLFLVGILKCVFKPWDLKRVSINSLIDSSAGSEVDSSAGSEVDSSSGSWEENSCKIVISSLDEYVVRAARAATEHFDDEDHPSDSAPVEISKSYLLFVDLAPPYFERLQWLKTLVHSPADTAYNYALVHSPADTAYNYVRSCLSQAFDRFYTKESLLFSFGDWLGWIAYLRLLVTGVSLVIVMQEQGTWNHRKPSKDIDVNSTLILITLAAILDYILPALMHIVPWVIPIVRQLGKGRFPRVIPIVRQLGKVRWPDEVAQYNLIGYLVRNKKHRKLRRLATLLVCKDYIDQLWCMKPSKSSRDITKLVHGYIAKGWTEHHIKDRTTYRAFNDNRGQWTLNREGFRDSLDWTLERPFDESVLLWHLATDFCFHLTKTPPSDETARLCRVMSNYMVYLLFFNPEMLMTGSRRSLFRAAYSQLKKTLIIESEDCAGFQHLALKIDHNIRDETRSKDFSIVNDAWDLAQELMKLQMWKVIQGVWVEMLCFAAGRCRGYLHAKSLSKGGEYLSYIWLLMSLMGMETLAERMQTTKLQQEETTNNGGSSNATTAASPAVAAGGTAAASPVSHSSEGDDMV